MLNQIKQTRLRIEKAIYEDRINVALEHAEKTKEYKSFKDDVEAGLLAQIRHVAKAKTIDFLLLFTKAAPPPLIKQVEVLLGSKSIAGYIDLKAFLVFSGTQGGQAALDKLQIDGTFGLTSPQLLEFFDNHANLVIRSVDEYTAKWIANQIQKGKEAGLGPREIAETLIDAGKGISKVRAERIALSELANAMIKTEIEAASRYGILYKTWRTSRDELVCPICLPLEGERAKIKGTFSGGIQGPQAHVGCRCFLQEEIPSDWSKPTNPWLGN